jgi:23S rRNA (pseudouridine1915-N3)-methyltransferase
MKHVELIAVGDLKFAPLKELEKKYGQSINYYVKFNVKNLRDIKAPHEQTVREKEGEMIRKALEEKDFVIALDRSGQKMDSVEFSRFLSEKLSYYAGRIVFLIGGYSGLSSALNPRIQTKISFSDMTFPHDLFRILFLEQLYRALTIIHGLPYHR